MADEADVLRILPGRLAGAVAAPPSKSIAHRALLCAWLAGDPACVRGVGPGTSNDIDATLGCLAALGAVRPGPLGERRAPPEIPKPVLLDCGESGTTLRLLVPIVAALGRAATFEGRGRLPQRPIGEYLAMLNGRGVLLSPPPSGSLPLGLRGRLLPGDFTVPGGVSSQYVSGMLLALPLLPEDSTLRVAGRLESAPYVDLTIAVQKAFGVSVERIPASGPVFRIPGGQSYRPVPYGVEGDWSNAAFWLVASFLGSKLRVDGLDEASAQGDRAVRAILARFAAAGASDGPIVVDAAQIPDLVPALAVAAVGCARDVRFVNAGRLRLKESDRLASTADALHRIGAEAEASADALLVRGRGAGAGDGRPLFAGGEADAWNDHRIAMALAVAGLRSRDGVAIRGWRAVEKSYPSFFDEFRRLGGEVHGIDVR